MGKTVTLSRPWCRSRPVAMIAMAVLIGTMLPLAPARASESTAKEQMVQDLIALRDQIVALRTQLAPDPGNQDLNSELAQAMSQYHALSRSMGGDEPAGIAPAEPPFDSKMLAHSRLRELELLIANARAVLANDPMNEQAQSDLDGALAEQDQISIELGGDLAPAAGDGGFAFVPAPSPPGCTATTTNASNTTPTPIVDVSTVSSTIVVAGAGPYLWDLDLQTFITHTFNADLDITITSPSGTVVTLSTDNGSSFDNVYNGTVWDDQADPDGVAPYATNNGLVGDHAYVNLTTATPLAPEEALGAFIGSNPNGTWTLSVSDDLGGDVGSINSWSLAVTTLPAAPTEATTSASNNTPVAIPTGPAVVSSTLVVAGAGSSISDVNLTTLITHTFNADLDITLTAPSGTVVTISTDNGSSNDNVYNGTLFSDESDPDGAVPYATNPGLVTDHPYVNLIPATPLVSEEGLAALNGQDPNGTWTLTISDDLGGDGGSLNGWTLDVTTASCAGAGGPCVCTPSTFTQSTPVAIPTGPAVVYLDARRRGRRALPVRPGPDHVHHPHVRCRPRHHAAVARRHHRDDLDRQRRELRQRVQRHAVGRQRGSGRPGALRVEQRPGQRPRLRQPDHGHAARRRGSARRVHRREPERHVDADHLRRPRLATAGRSTAGRWACAA